MPKPENIEALLFDLGGVLIDIDFECALDVWQHLTLLTVEEMRHRFKMDKAYEEHERGEISPSDYFSHLRNTLELEASDSEIAFGWNAIFVDEITDTVNYIHVVKNELPCFVFSNTNPTHHASWMSAFPRVVDSFEKIFVSSKLGLRKPEPEAFIAIAEATGIRLEATLFFDDTEENVKAARAVGMPAIHVTGHNDVKQALLEIGAL